MGLKFDAGKHHKSLIQLVNKNYRWDESDVEKGFIQGIQSYSPAVKPWQTEKVIACRVDTIKLYRL